MGRNKNGGSVTVNAQLSDFTGLSCCSASVRSMERCTIRSPASRVVSEEVWLKQPPYNETLGSNETNETIFGKWHNSLKREHGFWNSCGSLTWGMEQATQGKEMLSVEFLQNRIMEKSGNWDRKDLKPPKVRSWRKGWHASHTIPQSSILRNKILRNPFLLHASVIVVLLWGVFFLWAAADPFLDVSVT